MHNKLSLVTIVFIICVSSLFLSGCDNSVTARPDPTEPAGTPLPIPSDPILVSGLLDLYRSFVDQATIRNVLISMIDVTDYVVVAGNSNSAISYKIGINKDVLAPYHAKPGEFIEVSYPKIDGKFSTTPEFLVYHYYGRENRYWSIIQLFSLVGYNSTYLSLHDSGIWVRQWPVLEGSEEFKRFSNVEDAVQYIAHYGDL